MMHSWMIPAALWWATVNVWQPSGVFLALIVGALLGIASHVLGDLAFGMAGPGHPKGVPLFLWWGNVGLGLRADGLLERVTGAVLAVTAGWLAWALIYHLPPLAPLGWVHG